MSDIKPLGSERLQGMDKIRRILEISSYNEKKPVSINENSTSEYKLNLADGNQYQIVKEKTGYIIKKTLSESTTEYIEPLENRKFFKSYSQALRKLNLMAKEFNTLYDNSYGTQLFSEQKKFVLKGSKPKSSETAPPPSGDMSVPPPPGGDMGVPPPPGGDMGVPPPPGGDMGVPPPPGGDVGVPPPPGGDVEPQSPGEEDMGVPPPGSEDMDADQPEMGQEEGDVSLKSVQKLVGKLSQKLRTISKKEDEFDSKDIKYVINSVLSAIDMDKLEDEDKDEILSRFDGDEEEDVDVDMSDEDVDVEPEVTAPEPPEGEMTEEEESLGPKFAKAVSNGYKRTMMNKHPLMGELAEDEIQMVDSVLERLFTESKVDKILSKYFVLSESEKEKIKFKKQNLFREINRLSESVNQEMIAKKIVSRNPNVKLLGKTNKNNLVFVSENKQFRVSLSGRII